MTQIGDVKRVHMIGVGGSSMSGLAGLLKDEGLRGLRLGPYPLAQDRGAGSAWREVLIGHKPENVRGAQLVIYSAAIAPDNPERAEAARLGHTANGALRPHWAIDEGQQVRHPPSAARTARPPTTSMLAQVFLTAGRDPSVHIGGELDYLGAPRGAAGMSSSSRPASTTAVFCTSTPPWRSSSTSTRTIWTATGI